MISTIQDNFYKKTENVSNDYIAEEKNTQIKKQKKTVFLFRFLRKRGLRFGRCVRDGPCLGR